MNDSKNWPAQLSAPQRNHFFFGKMMGVAQFEREQRYGMGQRWLINRLTTGTGVLCGLEVTLTADGKKLRVAAGVAVDPWGREIVVVHPVDFDPFATDGGCPCCGDSTPVTEAKDYVLCLTYRECMTNAQPVQYADDCPGQPDCQPDTTVESFGLRLSPLETLTPFDCAAWTRPRTPTGDDAAPPPTIAELRARLLEQLGNSCAPPSSMCVALALVTATKTNDQWSLSVAEGPRRRIYTQAQLLEMILCLAKCCGSDHHDQTGVEPFVIEWIVFQNNSAQNEVNLKATTGTTFSLQKEIDRIRIVFNAPVDLNKAIAGITIMGGAGAVPGEVIADPNDPNSVIRTHREPANQFPNPFPPGDYKVVLSAGTIKDVPTPGASTRSLSGKPRSLPPDPAPPFPTGGDPGANDFGFEFMVNAP